MAKESNKFVKKYEWVGDVKSYKEPDENDPGTFSEAK